MSTLVGMDYDIGDELVIRSGKDAAIRVKVVGHTADGYYELESAETWFPLTLSEASLLKILVHD